MTLHNNVLISTVFILVCFGCVRVAKQESCAVPATSISEQAYDLCFYQFATDDIAHPGVQACYEMLASLPDDCQHRTRLKKYRCRLLFSEGNQPAGGLTMDDCVASKRTEGLFVNGCEYPFSKACVDSVHGDFGG